MTRERLTQVIGHKMPNGERIHNCNEGRQDYKVLKLAGCMVAVAVVIAGGLLVF